MEMTKIYTHRWPFTIPMVISSSDWTSISLFLFHLQYRGINFKVMMLKVSIRLNKMTFRRNVIILSKNIHLSLQLLSLRNKWFHVYLVSQRKLKDSMFSSDYINTANETLQHISEQSLHMWLPSCENNSKVIIKRKTTDKLMMIKCRQSSFYVWQRCEC